MRRTSFKTMNCSVARSLEVVGEWWTFLILRDAFRGRRRFEEFQRNLGIARNVLTVRLRGLVKHGILEAVPYQDRPARWDYQLTEKGRALFPVLVMLLKWGDRWAVGPSGPPVRLVHTACGHEADPILTCARCGGQIRGKEIRQEPSRETRKHARGASG